VRTLDLDYELPPERIAQHPTPERDGSRLMVVRRTASDAIVHGRFREIADHLSPQDLLVVNDTRVIPSRLIGAKATGGRIEILLVERESSAPAADTPDAPGVSGEEVWRCLAGFSRAPAPGAAIDLGPHLEGRWEGSARGEQHRIRLRATDGGSVRSALDRAGRIPLPPYISRDEPARPPGRIGATATIIATGATGEIDATGAIGPSAAPSAAGDEDAERYQTVYAARDGAIAAPTAGLHFTPALLSALEQRGIGLARVTLHVGPATFLPVRTEEIEDHPMDAERYEVPRATVLAIDRARARGGRIVAVGTTAVRALESAATGRGGVVPAHGRTDLFILPGYTFRVVDALVTNFHLPRSTLLAMVAAFAGRERMLAAYAEAIAAGYRFYSYGDAMLIL
jgi:S-adenosylmethionine:tRNA ribosyltransferase-isomerase